MHCVNCGTEIPAGAAFCPKCGAATAGGAPAGAGSGAAAAPAEPKKGRNKFGCLGIAALLVLLLIVAIVLAPRSADNSNSNKGAGDGKANPADLPVQVSATELFNAFQANEASAQSYFGHRKLLVTGTVDKVMLDFLDNPVVLLRTPNQFMSAHAALAAEAKPEAGNFAPGDKVKLFCEDISEVAATPMLKDCRTAPADAKGQPVQWSDKKKK